jgi:hypothetical protein
MTLAGLTGKLQAKGKKTFDRIFRTNRIKRKITGP